MPSRNSKPTPFSAGVQPILPGGGDAFMQRSIAGLSSALLSTERMTPSAASRAPREALDGMVRLSRWPWWPVAGQAADAWVYYDSTGVVWRFLNTAPTSSH